jgi:serine/threonine-protein kinase
MAGVLQGLHAAHGATDEDGAPLGIVHRDVSPQNVLVGSDGTARVFDFGIAKAVGRAHNTRDGQIKGKLAYMAPEQILGQDVDLRVDLFAAGTLLWEITTGHRLFYGDNEGAILHRVLHAEIPLPSTLSARIPPELDAVIMRALQREPQLRFATAAEMGAALEHAVAPAPTRDVAKWVLATEGEAIRHRADGVTAMEARFTDAVTLSAHDVSKRPERRMRRLWLAPAVIGVAVGAVGAVEWQRMQSNTRAPNAPASAPAPPSVEVAPPATASPPAMTVAPSATALPEPSVASASASPRRAPRKPPPTARPAATPAAPPPLYSRD